MSPTAPAVVVCTYTDRRWDRLRAAVRSVKDQALAPAEIVVVVDHHPELAARLRAVEPDCVVVEHGGRPGLAGARNRGVAASSADVVAFLDDDAEADPDWLALLVDGYGDGVLGVGGRVDPVWEGGRPDWFPEEFDWVVGCSYRGLPTTPAPVRNLLGANMSFRRGVLEEAGGFREGMGRVGTRPVGCEETELCLRARARRPEGVFVYDPRARVRHHVPAERARWAYFRARCWSEGLSKAAVARFAGSGPGLAAERAHAARTLPAGVARELRAAAGGTPGGTARSGAMAAGLGVAAAGYALGRVSTRDGDEPDGSGGWLEFDIHGRVAIRVAQDAPTAPQLADMLGPFRASGLACHHLTVTGDRPALHRPSRGEHEYAYTDGAVEIAATGAHIAATEDGYALHGPGELLTSVLPLLDRLMVDAGAAMVHAATFSLRGHGVCMPAWGGVGKTSTVAKVLRCEDAALMGDDWAFLSDEGRLLGYLKPMYIKPHHRPIYPHLFEDRRKPLVPSTLSRPVGRLTTLVHPFMTRHPKLARVARRYTPEYHAVTPQQAFPDAAIATDVPLAVSVFVERADLDGPSLEPRDREWMVARLVGNFHAELARPSRDVLTAMGATGLLPLERAVVDKAAVLRRALHDTPSFLLRVPTHWSADDASDAIVEHLHKALAEAGVA